MPKQAFKDRCAGWYSAFRGSPYFILSLVSLELIWGTLHFMTGFDSDWGALNLFLSTEASITTALLIIDLHRSDQAQHRMELAQSHQLSLQTQQLEMQSKQLRYILDVLRALRGQPPDDRPQD